MKVKFVKNSSKI